jgi:NodT family efflux transporter outer membrane factor (OMF) lipoprotein
MSQRLPLTLALAAALLGGCATDDGLTAHNTPRAMADLHASQSLTGTQVSDAAWPTEQWWAAFADPQLDALMQEALANAPSIEAADARTRKALAQAGVADAVRKPSVGASAQLAGMQLPETLAGDEIGGHFNLADVLMLKFAWNPDFWGVSRNKWQAAVGNARANEVDAQAARLALTSNIALTYGALAQAFDALDTAKAETTRSEALVALNQQRIKAGLDNGIALHQNQSAAALARQQTQAAEHQIQQLQNALAALLGAGPDRGASITRPQLQTPALVIPSDLPSGLLARRPDIVAARWRVEAAQRDVDASKAAFYPSINLSALVGLASGHLNELFDSKALLLSGGPALSLPIFEGGLLKQQLRSSQADYDLAVASYNQTLLSAIREVTDAVQSAHALDAQIGNAKQAYDTAHKAYTQIEQRQRAGLATRLDLLNAQKPLLQLEHQLSTLHAVRRSASIQLEQALGGGTAVSAPTATASNEYRHDH